MGSSGGGGGSAGEVSWPDYVSSQYTGLLGSNFTAAGVVTVESAMASAQGLNPYVDRDSFDATDLIEEMKQAVASLEEKIITINPIDSWDILFFEGKQRYMEIIEEYTVFHEPVPVAVSEIFNIWTLVEPALVAQQEIFDIWTLVEPALTAVEDIEGSWVDPTLDAPDDIKVDLAAATKIEAATIAHAATLDDQILTEILPRFEAGMRDINAVQSSAFVIGRAIIEAFRNRDVAKFDADLSYKAFLQRDNLLGQAHMQIDKLNSDNASEHNKLRSQAYLERQKILAAEVSDGNKLRATALLDKQKILGAEVAEGNKLRSQALIQADKIMADSDKAHSLINAEMVRHGTQMIYQDVDSHWKHIESSMDMYKAWAGYVVDSNRIYYVMGKESYDTETENLAKDARWDLDMAQIAGNLIASISGGTSYTPGPTPAQNALGGAFAGASIGARATGSAYGAGAGAILGGIGAYLMGR